MIYGYARVSTKGQAKDGNSLEVQEVGLRKAGATEILSDSFTGTKMKRPEFERLMDKIQKGDTLVVTKLDRFARTADDGFQQIQSLLERGIAVHVLNMGLIDNTPTGKLILHVMLAFAEFERDLIVQRTQEGKAVAKLDPHYKEGRPKKYSDEKIASALELIDNGMSYSKVVKLTGISKSTLVRANNLRAYYRQSNESMADN